MQLFALLILFLCYRNIVADSIAVLPSTTHRTPESAQVNNATVPKPQMYYFHVESDIKFRYARTVVSTRIANPANVAQEIFFSAVLPETAFISGFLMEVDGKVYKAYVREKEVAKKEYDEAVQQGQTAAHVALTARDSNRFTVSVNVEPKKKVTFNLTYEELIGRRLGVYRNVINLDLGQVVPDFSVVVHIEESSNITNLVVPPFKVNNTIETYNGADESNSLAITQRPTPTTAIITFSPTPDQQKEIATDGMKGQFIVEYDVDRKSHPGEVLVNDGYFVHFFAPVDLPPLSKQVTFVLDVSGSMGGRKIEQLRQAMVTILGDLNKDDFFSIVLFSQSAQVWDPTLSDSEMDEILRSVGNYFSMEEISLPQPNASAIAKATPDNIEKAKKFVEKLQATGGTDIYDGLIVALELARIGSKVTANATSQESKPEPIVIFLTDGQPNIRQSNPDIIISDVTKANERKSSIFSLALGYDADFNFLKKLSLRNSGFARKIYEDSDTALQLTDFYRGIASPQLANVTFEYEPDQVDNSSITKRNFRRLFDGSELVVAGKLNTDTDNLTTEVQGVSAMGKIDFRFRPIIWPIIPIPPHVNPVNHTPSFLERMWAYLTIQQLLEKDEAEDYDHNDKNATSPEKKRALELALKYSFVTPLTSLFVVKPNETKSVDTEDASQPTSSSAGYGVIPFASRRVYASSFSNSVKLRRPQFGFLGGNNPVIPVYSTTARIPPRAQPCQTSVTNIKWLPDNDTITLPVGVGGTDEVLQVGSANETDIAYSSCSTPTGQPGHCRHLRYCVLDSFTTTQVDFLPYCCHIDSYVGVCCPENPVPVRCQH